MKLFYTIRRPSGELFRSYKSIKSAKRHAFSETYSLYKYSPEKLVEIDTDELPYAEMTDQEAYEYHERQMLRHSELANAARMRLNS